MKGIVREAAAARIRELGLRLHLASLAAASSAFYPATVRGPLRLFDEIVRTDPRPARYAEGSFAFLNRVDDRFLRPFAN